MLIEEIKNIKSTKKDLRNFGLVVGIAFILLGGLLYWHEKATYPYFIIPGFALVISGLLIPAVLKPLQKVWMTFAVIMGWFMTRLILGVLFYLVFSILGLGAKIFGKSFLDREINKSTDSYWKYRPVKEFEKISCERQF